MTGLQTVNTAECRGNSDRSAAVGTQSDRDKTGADGVGRAAGRTARVVFWVVGVDGRAFRWVVVRRVWYAFSYSSEAPVEVSNQDQAHAC